MVKKMNFQVTKDFLVHVFYVIMIILFLYILGAVLFYNHINVVKENGGLVLLSTIFYGVIFYVIYRKLLMKVKHERRFIISLFVLLFIVQLLFAYFFVVNPTWDFGLVHNGAILDVTNVSGITDYQYLYACGNNIGVTLLLKVWYSIFHIFHFDHFVFLGIVLNIILIDLGLFYLYRVMNLFFSKEKVCFYMLLSCLLTPFITYVPIFYTDTLSIPFAIASIYYYFCFQQGKNNKWWNLLLCGLFIGVGTCIKFTVIFVLIAFLLYFIFRQDRDQLKVTIKHFAIIVLGFCLSFGLFKAYTKIAFDQVRLEKYNVPVTHYFMMGLKGNGGYDADDSNFTATKLGQKDKMNANIKVIKSRLHRMVKKHQILAFYTNKLVYVWGDGTFFAPVKLIRDPKKENPFQKYIVNTPTNLYKPYHFIAQSQLIIILFFLLLGMILRKYLSVKQQDLQLLLNILIFGIVLFFILWEARSRYIVNFIPILALSSYFGIEATMNYLEHRRKKNDL